MMKKFICVTLVLPVLFICGFKKKSKPVIILSSNRITSESAYTIENNFNANSRIYYALFAKDGFKYPGIRLQISKQDDKTSNWGLSIVFARDIYLDMAKNVYDDSISLPQAGHYIIQFFYLNNKDYPFAHREFRVN